MGARPLPVDPVGGVRVTPRSLPRPVDEPNAFEAVVFVGLFLQTLGFVLVGGFVFSFVMSGGMIMPEEPVPPPPPGEVARAVLPWAFLAVASGAAAVAAWRGCRGGRWARAFGLVSVAVTVLVDAAIAAVLSAELLTMPADGDLAAPVELAIPLIFVVAVGSGCFALMLRGPRDATHPSRPVRVRDG